MTVITQSRRAFSMMCAVKVNIQAKADVVWKILTDAEGFPRWNSTVTRIEGQIAEGQRIRLFVPGTDRSFTPTISDFVPNQRMVWTGGFSPVFKGVRVFALTSNGDDSTNFAMEERFSGLMLPIARGAMPNFGPIFETYANDLKRESERLRA